jgi:hypothetical protein
MNQKLDFKNLSPLEIETLCRQIAEQKNALEAESRRQENILQQTRAHNSNLRGQTQTLLEQMIAALMPDTNEPTKNRLRQIFPQNPELLQDLSSSSQNKGFWSSISSFFSGAPDPLEQKRVLLRGILWQLNQPPPNAGELTGLFRAFLDAKNNYFQQDQLLNRQESAANQNIQRINELKAQLKRCQDWIRGRKGNDYYGGSIHDSFDYDETSSYSNSYDSDRQTENQSSDYTDFGGGGTGGSWENYS